VGLSLKEIAGKYNVQLADAHAAMTYYYDHRAEIDGDMERDNAFVKAIHPEKWRSATHASSPVRKHGGSYSEQTRFVFMNLADKSGVSLYDQTVSQR